MDELGVDRRHAHVAVASALDAHLVAIGLLIEMRRDDDTFAAAVQSDGRFKAFLVKQPDGKIGFEFQAKAPKAPAEEKTTRPGSGRRARSTR
jgi:hypothetical protein